MKISGSLIHILLVVPAMAVHGEDPVNPVSLPGWEQIPAVAMKGDLRVFWNVGGADRDAAEREAEKRGFELVDLLNTYSDYPGRQKEKIIPEPDNPWVKPDYFERIIRRNNGMLRGKAIFVHDIEFHFEEDLEKLWEDPGQRTASGAEDIDSFREKYYRAWASWYALPCLWAKQRWPGTPVGIYGPQPFRRDYWGIAGRDAQQIDGTHKTDAELWQHIEPAVDFCVASIYCFYDQPGSVYYMASNIEENLRRMERSDKPVYAYTWLRYHDSNKKLKGRELDDFLVEAMAVIPYFYGAKAQVLWGWEPKPESEGPYYRQLPLFVKHLRRVARFSELISRAERVPDQAVHLAWKKKEALVQKLRAGADEWLVLAANPWQGDGEEGTIRVSLGERPVDLTISGRHVEIYHICGAAVERIVVE